MDQPTVDPPEAEGVGHVHAQTRDTWPLPARSAGAARIGSRNEVSSRHVPSVGTRAGGSHARPPFHLNRPETERPTIPAAREETIELSAVQTASTTQIATQPVAPATSPERLWPS